MAPAFRIVSAASGQVVVPFNRDQARPYSILEQQPDANMPDDSWRLESVAATIFRLHHLQSGLVAAQFIALPDDGLPIEVVEMGATAGQEWDLERVNATQFRIRSVLTGLVWDLPGGSHTAGTQILQHQEQNGANQHWLFVPVLASLNGQAAA
jgi:hypothetical protein